jgi:hypothetical protein
MQEWLYEGDGKWDRGINKAIILMSLQPARWYILPYPYMWRIVTRLNETSVD